VATFVHLTSAANMQRIRLLLVLLIIQCIAF